MVVVDAEDVNVVVAAADVVEVDVVAADAFDDVVTPSSV